MPAEVASVTKYNNLPTYRAGINNNHLPKPLYKSTCKTVE